ncbi:MAG: hypothetical protein KGM47_01310 [Acidobacteriota bacterium]|nr:hypothetical protein [Acidobacteriota bacterium]
MLRSSVVRRTLLYVCERFGVRGAAAPCRFAPASLLAALNQELTASKLALKKAAASRRTPDGGQYK